MCKDDKAKIQLSISPSNVSYELCVHISSAPESVEVDSNKPSKLADKAAYDSATQGWYYGRGSFYGSKSVATLNIKVPKASKAHVISVAK